jgi:hypothetical protein
MSNFKLQGMRASSVTPSNTVNIPSISGNTTAQACVLYIGSGGTLKVLTEGKDEVTFVNVPSGSFLPVNVLRVFAEGTSAGDIIAIW